MEDDPLLKGKGPEEEQGSSGQRKGKQEAAAVDIWLSETHTTNIMKMITV